MIIFIFLLCVASNAWADAGKELQWVKAATVNTDWSCVKPKIVGACSIGPDPGVLLSYWKPAFVIKTYQAIGSSQFSGSNLHFNEADVHGFPLESLEEVVLCPDLPEIPGILKYSSKMDKKQWRQDTSSLPINIIINNWGRIFPRNGFVVHYSSAVSSALTALRAVNIVSDPVLGGHMVLALPDFMMDTARDRIQMVYPQKTQCMELGRDARLWETDGTSSRDGTYTWIYWQFIPKCCKPIVPP